MACVVWTVQCCEAPLRPVIVSETPCTRTEIPADGQRSWVVTTTAYNCCWSTTVWRLIVHTQHSFHSSSSRLLRPEYISDSLLYIATYCIVSFQPTVDGCITTCKTFCKTCTTVATLFIAFCCNLQLAAIWVKNSPIFVTVATRVGPGKIWIAPMNRPSTKTPCLVQTRPLWHLYKPSYGQFGSKMVENSKFNISKSI